MIMVLEDLYQSLRIRTLFVLIVCFYKQVFKNIEYLEHNKALWKVDAPK